MMLLQFGLNREEKGVMPEKYLQYWLSCDYQDMSDFKIVSRFIHKYR
jgi:hypothetical protein